MVKLDPIQMQRLSFDDEKNAYRVDLVPTDIAVELDHTDGDSVYSHKKMQVLEYKIGQVLDTSHVEIICCTEDVVLTAVILDQELTLANLSKLNPLTICVPAIKINKNCIVILRG